MGENKSPTFLYFFLLLLFTLHSCLSTNSKKFGEIIRQGDVIEGTGTIIHLGLEGGFYGIITSTDHFDPINLPSKFTKDSLRVKFKAKIRKDLVSTHMWGILIELISIEKI